MTNSGSDKPDKTPDLGAAAKQFWAAAKAKAKEIGQKATDAAKDLQAKAQQGQVPTVQPGASTDATPAPDVGAKAASTSPTSTALLKSPAVRGCLALVACLLMCGVCGGVLNLFGVGGSKDGVNHLSSFEDTPPFVAEHVKKGCIVYELKDWQFSDVEESIPATLYAVIYGDKLSRVYVKRTAYYEDVRRKSGPNWLELTRFASPPFSLAYHHEGKRLESVTTHKPGSIHTEVTLKVNLQVDKNGNKGRWEGSVTRDEKDTSSKPRFPAQHKVTKIRGDLIVHRS